MRGVSGWLPRDPVWSGCEGCGGGVLLFGRVGDAAGAGEDVEAEVAAAFDPLVVLLGEYGADEADDRAAVGEDPDHVGAAADLLVQLLLGVVRPDLPPDLLREGGERQQVRRDRARRSSPPVLGEIPHP